MIFSGCHANADPSSASDRVVIKIVAEDSVEISHVQNLRDDPELHIVPVIALLNAFAVYDGHRMRGVCMPFMSTLAEAIWPGNTAVLECDAAVRTMARQLLLVSGSSCCVRVGCVVRVHETCWHNLNVHPSHHNFDYLRQIVAAGHEREYWLGDIKPSNIVFDMAGSAPPCPSTCHVGCTGICPRLFVIDLESVVRS